MKQISMVAAVFAALTLAAAAQELKTVRQSSGSSWSVREYMELGSASEPCEPAVCDWWERLRISANNYLKKGGSKEIRNFVNIFAEGLGKNYRVPVVDQPPKLIALSRPQTSARTQLVNGKVTLLIEIREDGGVGSVDVSQGVRDDLDAACIRSFRQSIFLPAVKNGKFVSDTQTGGCTFAAGRGTR